MDFSQVERNSSRKFFGIALVAFLHALVVYALVTGLARKVIDVMQAPLEAKMIEEIKPPPPPDLPPPPPQPKLLAPPPFIPPPEVQVQQPMPNNAIQATTQVQPENPVMPPIQRNDAAATGAVNTPAVVDFTSCAKPEYPRNSLRNEETGAVTLAFLIGLDGRVVDSKLEKSSGFPNLDKTARAALNLCRFKPGMMDGKPQQSWTKVQYVWKLE